MIKHLQELLPKKIERSQARDTGMAMVLISLILALWLGESLYVKLATALLVVTMVAPALFKPLGYVWFGLAHLMGTVMSKVLLFIVYLLIVTPVGLLRKASGKDPMQMKKWKKDHSSVFTNRALRYTAHDIEKPY